MRIAFDMDGVVANTQLIAHRITKLRYGSNLLAHLTQYDPSSFFAELIPDEEKRQEFCEDLWVEATRTAPPFRGAGEALRKFQQSGGTVQFVTARPIAWKSLTLEWLDRTFPWLDYRVHFVECAEKASFLESEGFSWMVEDRLRTVNQVAERLGRGILINRRWNRGRDTLPGVVRVRNLDEAYAVWWKENGGNGPA